MKAARRGDLGRGMGPRLAPAGVTSGSGSRDTYRHRPARGLLGRCEARPFFRWSWRDCLRSSDTEPLVGHVSRVNSCSHAGAAGHNRDAAANRCADACAAHASANPRARGGAHAGCIRDLRVRDFPDEARPDSDGCGPDGSECELLDHRHVQLRAEHGAGPDAEAGRYVGQRELVVDRRDQYDARHLPDRCSLRRRKRTGDVHSAVDAEPQVRPDSADAC